MDAYFLKPDAVTLRSAVARVAARLALREDWLNDSAKGYFEGLTQGEVLYESSFLTARAASVRQLLATKLAAWRDAIDRSDARLLLEILTGSRAEVWRAVEPHVPPQHRDNASYAFDDLWETTHGRS